MGNYLYINNKKTKRWLNGFYTLLYLQIITIEDLAIYLNLIKEAREFHEFKCPRFR